MPQGAAVLNHDILTAALAGLEAKRQTIDHHLAQVRSMLGIHGDGSKRRGRPPKTAAPSTPTEVPAPRKRRKFSAATRRKMAEAQRKRYAALRNATVVETGATPKPAGKKRTMSAAARKRIGDAARKRWAAVRKAASKPAVAAKKRATRPLVRAVPTIVRRAAPILKRVAKIAAPVVG